MCTVHCVSECVMGISTVQMSRLHCVGVLLGETHYIILLMCRRKSAQSSTRVEEVRYVSKNIVNSKFQRNAKF